MHVALIGSPTATMNGPARVHHGLAGGLARRGHEVTMYGLGPCQDHPVEGVNVVPIPCGDSVRDAIVAHREAIDTARDADHDVVHSLVHHTRGADIVTVQWTTTSLDLALRGAWRALPDTRSLLGEGALSFSRRRAAAAAPITVASSPETARQLRQYWRLEPDEVVPLGIPEAWITPDPDLERDRVLIPGRISPKKGQKRVLDYLSPEDERYTVDIVGGVADGVAADEYATCLSWWEDQYHGRVSDAEMRDWYARAGVAVVPSIHENFGLTALEALAHGTPIVVASSVGLSAFPWATPENGIYAASDGRSMAARVVRLLESPTEHALASGRAYRLARSLIWPRIAQRYESLYAQVADLSATDTGPKELALA